MFSKDTVINDIIMTEFTIRGSRSKRYGKIFFNTNEDIEDICENVDFKDKEVLSVLASSDQMFHFYNSGAKHVDTIDINKLTKHYFYLRKWTIQLLGKYYPDTNLDSRFIKNLLELVSCQNEDEQKSFDYWSKYADRFSPTDTEKLFYHSLEDFNPEIADLSSLSDKLKEEEFVFYHQSLGDKVETDKKYDIIFASNVFDYVGDDAEISLKKFADNFHKLLKDDGKIVCSSVLRVNPGYYEQIAFKEKFDVEMLPFKERELSSGYCYMKKGEK